MPDGTIRHLRKSHDFPGHAHELTFSCYHGLQLLSKNRTRQWFVEALKLARKKHDLQLWAYVIMPEHAHVLLMPQRSEYQISAILKTMKQSVSRRAIRHLRTVAPHWLDLLAVQQADGRVEHHFWQPGGGYDRNIIRVRTAHAAVHYIHNNPVRRGLVASPADWPWSSAGWYHGHRDHSRLEMDDFLPAWDR